MSGTGVVRINVLGTWSVERADGSLVRDSEWGSARAVELLRFLATRAGTVLEPDDVAYALWGETGHRAAASLRDAASRIQLTLGSVCVAPVDTGMALVDVWVDLFAFERRARAVRRHARRGEHALAVAALHDAEELYGGDFLALEDADAWVGHERERLRQLRSDILVKAAASASAIDQPQLALELSHRAVLVDLKREQSRCVGERVGAARNRLSTRPGEQLARVLAFPVRARA